MAVVIEAVGLKLEMARLRLQLTSRQEKRAKCVVGWM